LDEILFDKGVSSGISGNGDIQIKTKNLENGKIPFF